ncbi:hypothetical protein AB0J83_01790 [Actinoplanes sp. NPDC049596]|uniref:SCO7613 C-terminal domain-containing membrane protein n=1 Tax=unclassified Actinoplanes TaxID=2626549 RepID=UPI003429DCFF
MSYPCAYCGNTASETAGCPGCGRGPDPDAIEVMRADAEITELIRRLGAARNVVAEIEAALGLAWNRRNAAAARVRARVPAAAPASPNRTVQNVLFLLGGLLLGVAAVVFTAVAWAQFGDGGRAALLAGFTGAALTVPPVALRRGLTATAETFAAVGLLLTLLCGYAAWYINLFGEISKFGYAAAVFAVTGAVAVGYEHFTGLVAPRYIALLAGQPVLPLLVAIADPGLGGWAFAFAGVAALDVVVLAAGRMRVAAAITGAVAVVVGGGCALVGLAVADGVAEAVGPAAGLLAAAAVVVAGAAVTRRPVSSTTAALTVSASPSPATQPAAAASTRPSLALQSAAAALLVVAFVVAAGRVVALASPAMWLVDMAAVVLAAAITIVAAATIPLRAAATHPLRAATTHLPRAALAGLVPTVGARVGGLAATAVLGGAVFVVTVDRVTAGRADWAVAGALAVAAVVLLPRPWRWSAGLLAAHAVLAEAVVLVLAGEAVTVLEAYSLIAASVALSLGLLVRRARPAVGSWTTYGPALIVALAPSLILILVEDGQHLRRLLLGLGALAVLLAGARFGLRAPVLLGGGALALVALHELAPVWDLLPRWIPLAAAGLLLVLLAMTLERRRRDLHRFRAVLHRMS